MRVFKCGMALASGLCFFMLAPSAHAASYGGRSFSEGESRVFHFETSLIPVFSRGNESTGADLYNPPPAETQTTLGADIRTSLGGVLWNTVFLGGTLNYRSTSTKRGAVAGGLESANDSVSSIDFGPTLGFFFGDFRIMATALGIGSRKTVSKGSTSTGTTTTDITRTAKLGLGYQIMVGYTFQLTGALKIGPTLAWRQVNYRLETLTDAVTPTNNYTNVGYFTRPVDGGLQPMVTLALDL